MAEVFAEAARQRQRRGLAASLASVTTVLLVIFGVALLWPGSSLKVTPATKPTELLHLVQAVPLPTDAEALGSNPLTENSHNQPQQAGYLEEQRFWTTTESPKNALATMTAQPPAGLVAGATSAGTNGGLANVGAYFDAAETATVDGPHLSLEAQTLADGRTALIIRAWQTMKPAKTADEIVTGANSATMSGPFGSATVTGAEAMQLAGDINALWVTVAPLPHECSGAPVELTLATASATRRFSLSCGRVMPDPTSDQAALLDSTTLANDLARFFPSLIPTPVASTHPTPGSATIRSTG